MSFEVNPKGIRCPACQGKDWRVIRTRDGSGYRRRRHACNNPDCLARKVRWTTYQYDNPPEADDEGSTGNGHHI